MSRDLLASIRCIRLQVSRRSTYLFVQLSTSGGLHGLGEATMSGDDTATAGLAQRYFSELLEGQGLERFGAPSIVWYPRRGPAPVPAQRPRFRHWSRLCGIYGGSNWVFRCMHCLGELGDA